MIDAEMAGRTWAMGDEFTMADCAAAPPLFYIDKFSPLGSEYKNAARLSAPAAGAPVIRQDHRRGAALFLICFPP